MAGAVISPGDGIGRAWRPDTSAALTPLPALAPVTAGLETAAVGSAR